MIGEDEATETDSAHTKHHTAKSSPTRFKRAVESDPWPLWHRTLFLFPIMLAALATSSVRTTAAGSPSL
jgi:hypothetical protein